MKAALGDPFSALRLLADMADTPRVVLHLPSPLPGPASPLPGPSDPLTPLPTPPHPMQLVLLLMVAGTHARFLLQAPMQLASVVFAAASTSTVCTAAFASTQGLGCMGLMSALQLSVGVVLPSALIQIMDSRDRAIHAPAGPAKAGDGVSKPPMHAALDQPPAPALRPVMMRGASQHLAPAKGGGGDSLLACT
jgi:hypothetical protein